MAVTLALLSLLGWLLDRRMLTSLIPDAPTLKPNTAISIVCAGTALVLNGRLLAPRPATEREWRTRAAARLLSLAPLALGIATLTQYVFSIDLGIDQLLLPDRWTRQAEFPGRPTWFSGVALVLVALPLLLGDGSRHRLAFSAGTIALGAVSWFCVVTFVNHVGVAPEPRSLRTLSLPAALCYLALAYGALWLRPDDGLIRILTSPTLAGHASRRLIPFGLVLPGALGWVYVQARYQHWLGLEVGIASLTTAATLGYLGLTWLNARGMLRLENERLDASARTQEALLRAKAAQEALQRLTDRLRIATKAARIGIWDWDLTTNALVWDAHMYEIYGASEGSFGGTYDLWRERVLPEDLPGVEREIHESLVQVRDLRHEFRIRRPDGSVRVIEGRGLVQRDSAGTPLRMLGADADITAQRDAEARLRASEQRFRAIFDSAFQFVGLLDTEGRVLEANQTALEFAGVSAQAVIGKPFWQTPWWAGSGAREAALRDAIRRAAKGELVRFRTTHPARTGELANIDFSLKPICDDQGKVVALLPEGRDITQLEVARQALQDSEERFRAAMEYAAIGIALVGLDGRMQKVNHALCEILGYSEHELLERTFRQVTYPEDIAADEGHVQELLTGRVSHYHLEKRYLHKQGHLVWCLLSASLVRSASGEPRLFVGEVQDITAQKAYEAQLRESVAEKEVLLKEIHHRVKNNLQVISSILRLQAEQSGSAEIRAMVQDSHTRIQTMALIHDRHYQSQNLASIDFGAHLRQLSEMLLCIFGGADRRIRLELALDPVALNLDAAIPLGLVANELITNALKHAFVGRNTGTLWVSLTRRESALELEVADDGVGFPADLDFAAGRSLGLRLIKALTRQMQGQLRLERADRNAVCVTTPLRSAR